ncbi:MAG: VCBS repeat-containing protein [Thermoanaerobaculia bacterium]|nr:VCBS repeat-containing protein [Thermoanaerobaculia bacterium]
MTDSDSVVGYHKTAPHGSFGAGNLIGQFGKNSRIQSGSFRKPVALNAVDLTGDGHAEVLYEGHNLADLLWQGSRAIFDHEGRILWRRWYDFAETTGLATHWPNAAQMIPLNLDGGTPEIVSWHHTSQLLYEEWDGVELVPKSGGWPASFGNLFPSPPAVGDVDGDGQEEFVIALYDPTNLSAAGALTILEQNGSVAATVPVATGLKNTPCLADVDGSGDLDIVVRDLDGRILIFDTNGGDTARVSWATEYQNFQRTGALDMELYSALAPKVRPAVEGFERVQLEWQVSETTGLLGFRVLRRKYEGPGALETVALLGPATRFFDDRGLENGELYLYFVEADYPGGSHRSAPIPGLPWVEGNLLRNSGVELNGDAYWDKWYTGSIGWSDMERTENESHSGRASMRIHLEGQGNNSSIKQWNQYGVIDAQIPVTPGESYSFGGFFKTDLNRASTHFLEWGSDYDRWRHDPVGDPIPLREWPFYFTPHVETEPSESEWIYSNRVFTVQPGITGISPRHRFHVTGGTATGDVYLDGLFFRKLGTDSMDASTPLPFASSWRYFDGTPPASWPLPGFNDSSWPVGQAKFGAGSGPNSVNTALPQFRDQFYFRKRFQLADPEVVELVAHGLSTTGPGAGPGIREIYLNGTELPIPDPGLSDNPGNKLRRLDLSPFIDVLQAGDNLIAIKLENEYSGWDDVAFDFQLRVLDEPPELGLIFADSFEAGNTMAWSQVVP